MSNKAIGYTVFIGALGMMLTLLAGDISNLNHWSEAVQPGFVAGVIAHLGAVAGAFVGGKLLPGPGDPPQK